MNNALLTRTTRRRILLSALWVASGGRRVGTKETKFKTQGLFDLGDLGLGSLDGTIIAIGDSNADQFRDLFSLSSDQRAVSLHLWDHQLYQFVSVPTNPVIPETRGRFVITNIIVTDINYDGRLDILAMGPEDPTDDDSSLKMEVWYGMDGTTFAPGIPIPSSLSAHPLVLDSQGTMAMDLLGLPSSLPSVFKVWKNQASASSNSSAPFSIKEPPFTPAINCKLPNPHSSAFIDLDGDCLADIFLTCQDAQGEQSYQIWINNKAAGFSLARTGVLPFGTKSVSFADMDRDGTIDMLLAVCPSQENCAIHVAYNQQIPLCASGSQRQCRDPQNLCMADADFRFSFNSSESGFTTLDMAQLFPEHRLVTELTRSDFVGPSPVSVQVGDYNLDGYPDLLVLVEPTDGSSSAGGTRGTPRLLESVACTTDGGCTALETQNHRRTFRTLVAGTEALHDITDAKGAFFMDINEDGSLDVVIQRALPLHPPSSDSPAARAISIFKNNFFNDAFFLKAIMLNGACSSRCPARDGRADYRPYGVNYAGASYKFTIQDTYGKRRATAVGQMPFNMYASPASPYSFFGLGRTNNYVEEMYVGGTRHEGVHYVKIEGVLPNSQLVVIPFQPRGVASGPEAWKKELFLQPADWIPWVSLSLVAVTSLLAILVAVLHLNQKQEDERERRRKAHTINFDAL